MEAGKHDKILMKTRIDVWEYKIAKYDDIDGFRRNKIFLVHVATSGYVQTSSGKVFPFKMRLTKKKCVSSTEDDTEGFYF